MSKNMEFPLKILCINRAFTFRIASPRWSISINKNHCPCQHEFHKAEIILRHAQTDTSHPWILITICSGPGKVLYYMAHKTLLEKQTPSFQMNCLLLWWGHWSLYEKRGLYSHVSEWDRVVIRAVTGRLSKQRSKAISKPGCVGLSWTF